MTALITIGFLLAFGLLVAAIVFGEEAMERPSRRRVRDRAMARAAMLDRLAAERRAECESGGDAA